MSLQSYYPVCHHGSQYDFSCRDLMFNLYERHVYQRCAHCDFMFNNPQPLLPQLSSFYPINYEVYEEESRLKKISPLRKYILKKYYCCAHLNSNPLIDAVTEYLKLETSSCFKREYPLKHLNCLNNIQPALIIDDILGHNHP